MKIHIITYGCTANQADSSIMGSVVEEAGHQISDLKSADCVLVNTCAVKQATENKMIAKISNLSKTDKKIIVGGCLTTVNINRIKKASPGFSGILDTKSIDKLPVILENVGSGKKNLIVFSDMPPVKPRMVRRDPQSATGIVQLSEGCNLSCTYCATTVARGDLVCFSPDDIVRASSHLVKAGCRELLLTSQDNGAYRYGKTMLPDLLEEVCGIDGDFFVRNGMTNPVYMNLILRDLIEAYKNPKVYKLLHVPVQSGSDKILKSMKRGYTAAFFREMLSSFRKEILELTVSTDIIVGFPGETEADFQRTIDLVEDVKPDVVNISKFGKRPGTAAEGMEELDAGIVNSRSRKLSYIAKKISLEKNIMWVGWRGKAFVGPDLSCKTPFYKAIKVEGAECFAGNVVDVEITGCTSAGLIGRVTA